MLRDSGKAPGRNSGGPNEIAAAKQADRVARIDEAAAQRLTTKIQLRLDVIADNVEQVIPMITEAKAGSVHEVLGYRSWTEYVAEEFGGRLQRLARVDRRPLVQLLADQGMSTRAIAPILGVGKSTVARELAAGVPDGTPEPKPVVGIAAAGDASASPEPKPVVGIDGKTYTRPNAVQRADEATGREQALAEAVMKRSETLDAAIYLLEEIGTYPDRVVALVNEYTPLYPTSPITADRLRVAADGLDHITQEWKAATAEAPAAPRKWARKIERISGSIPFTQMSEEDLADAQGAAEFLFYLLRGEATTRLTSELQAAGPNGTEAGGPA